MCWFAADMQGSANRLNRQHAAVRRAHPCLTHGGLLLCVTTSWRARGFAAHGICHVLHPQQASTRPTELHCLRLTRAASSRRPAATRRGSDVLSDV
jgi:hypothetical protein